MRCTSYCTASAYKIDDLARYLREEGLEPKFYDQVIHVSTGTSDIVKDRFYFPYGSMVFWGHSVEEEESYLEAIKEFQTDALPEHIIENSSYEYDIEGAETSINEEEDKVILGSDDVLIKLSISHAMSQSVTLSIFENSVSKTITQTRFLSEELSKSGKVNISRKEVAKLIGKLFAERNNINLNYDILDTPEFFWRRPRYETYYNMAREYIDIQTRLELIEKRLNVIHELYQRLSDELNNRHSSYLEIIIIFLITIEVVLVILKDILKWL